MAETTGSVSMHRVVNLNTLCSIASIYFATHHNRFFSEPPTLFEENNALMNYFIFGKVLRNVFSVEVGNLQSTSIKFRLDAVCQKSLKLVNI